MVNILPLESENLYPPNTYPTVVDFSLKFGYGAKLVAALAVLSDAQGERCLGVVRQSTASTASHGVEVATTPGMSVTCKAGAGGITAAGDEVTADGSGMWESAASGDVVIGHASKAAASGETFICYLCHQYVKA